MAARSLPVASGTIRSSAYLQTAMARNPLQLRRERYFKLSSHIAQIENAEMRALLAESEQSTGWGKNQTLEIGRSKVFVKRVPVTQVEYDHMFSTRNLYDLPLYYNYGVGSAGLGVFRELATYIKTTNWVLEGAIASFPLTYHYRIIPFLGTHSDVDMERHKGYVEYWGDNANIGRYVLDRANAGFELLLFQEHVPHILENWLRAHPDKADRCLGDLRATIRFLRQKGVIHFDAHFWNVLTDGEQVYLTDFGLTLDKSFSLTEEEQAFFQRHIDYDYGEILSSLGVLMFRFYEALPEAEKRRAMERYGIADGAQYSEVIPLLLNNIEQIYHEGIVKLDKSYVASVVRYMSIISLMNSFYTDMWSNSKKDTKFHHRKLRRLLREANFLG
jgi:hypothetical protein